MLEPGDVRVRWRESGRWRETVLSVGDVPKTHEERREALRQRLVWRGSPLVEAYMQAAQAA